MRVLDDKSLKHLSTCDPRLVLVAKEAIKVVPFKIICGHRPDADQEKAFKNGFSKKRAGESKHSPYPSLAFDFIPDPFDTWDNIHSFTFVAGVIIATGFRLGIPLVYGGDFDKDGNLKNGWDWGHVELGD